jgi:hypothetical protein
MGNPRDIRPDEVEIVVARELRKAGVPLSNVRVLSRRALAADDASEYAIDLAGLASGASAGRAVLVEFRNEASEVTLASMAALAARVPAAPPADGPKRLQPVESAAAPAGEPLRVLVSTTGFDVAAAREAASLGVMLLRIADGREAFLRSQWAMGSQPPAWVPEYMAELVDVGPTGEVRYQMITGAAKERPR